MPSHNSENKTTANSFKASLVKMFPCLSSQDKKSTKILHLINITRCPFNTSLHKEISHLRSNKFDNETIFLPI
jgi:aminoglycoside phosphotransferase